MDPALPIDAEVNGFPVGDMSAVPRGQRDDWAREYGSGRLRSPTLTDTCDGVGGGSPMQSAEQGFMAAYGSARVS